MNNYLINNNEPKILPENEPLCKSQKNNIIEQNDREIFELPGGCLGNTELRLLCKGPTEKKFYSFSVKNRMLADDKIASVKVGPASDSNVMANKYTFQDQTFTVRLSGGKLNRNVPIRCEITTEQEETIDFVCILPIRAEGVLYENNDGLVVIMGATGPKGEKGEPGESKNGNKSNIIIRDINTLYTGVSIVDTYNFTIINQDKWTGKTVSKIGFNVKTAGTLTVMLIEKPNSNDFTIIKKTTINLVVGQKWYDLNWDIGTDQYISIVNPTDTGRFFFSNNNPDNDGKFCYFDPKLLSWKVTTNDLNMGIIINDVPMTSLTYLNNKKLSILGDSISTFKSFISDGFATKYPFADVTSVEDTWWYQVKDLLGYDLLENNSFSGSRVSNGGNGSLQTRLNSISDETDLCLIFMGTNDLGNGVKFGYFDPSKKEFDLTEFTDAFCNAITKLQIQYPMTKFIWMTPLKRFVSPSDNTQYANAGQTVDSYTYRIIEACNYYGIEYLDMRGLGITSMNQTRYLVDGLHPNKAGMQLLSTFVYKKLYNTF